MIFLVVLCVLLELTNGVSVPRGAQIRLTSSALNYGAGFGIKALHRELRYKRLPNANGRSGDVHWNANNVELRNFHTSSHVIQLMQHRGLRVRLNGISLRASTRVSFQYRKGWIKIGDSTNVNANANGLNLMLEVALKLGQCKNGNQQCKPTLKTTNCQASINNLKLHFSGGHSWLYNIFSGLLADKLKGEISKAICSQGRAVIDKEANKFLSTFPTRQNIANVALLDYSFQAFDISNSYFDLLLRGEFLDRSNPVSSGLQPPIFDTFSGSNKMVHVWLSDYLINSAGKVLHDAGRLKEVVSAQSKVIPKGVKSFLQTKSFEQILPELYKKYPDRPVQFRVGTYKAPLVEIDTGKIGLKLYAKVAIEVVQADNTPVQIFYLMVDVNAKGSILTDGANNELKIGGKVTDFDFTANVGGSIIGKVDIPLENQSIKDMVQGLVVDQANPLLEKGFPIPKIKDLNLRNTHIVIVKNAIRVDSDLVYTGSVK